MEPTKRFVWWSTDKSVADSVPSAALETVVAVGAYWAIAIYFETTTHLWVSICVAPLLLLRMTSRSRSERDGLVIISDERRNSTTNSAMN